jgi:hypothetical protein
MEGSDGPYDECPECFKSTYVYEEERCLYCGYHQEDKNCAVCNVPLDLEMAHEGGLCSYHKWAMEKDKD